MEITLYLDVVFLVNFSVDFFLLLMLRRILKLKGRRMGLAAGSAAGAIFSALFLWLFLWLELEQGAGEGLTGKLGLLFIQAAGILGGGCLMLHLAFCLEHPKRFLQSLAGLMLASALTAGLLEWSLGLFRLSFFSLDFLTLLFFLTGCCLMGEAVLRVVEEEKKQRECCYQVTLYCQGRKISAQGFLDTGNRLQDPISGRPVHVADSGLLKELNPPPERMMVIPYRTIDGGGSILGAAVLDRMEVTQGKETRVYERPLVASSPAAFKMKNGCRILLHD